MLGLGCRGGTGWGLFWAWLSRGSWDRMEGQWEGQAEGSPQAGKRTLTCWGGSVDVRLNEVQGQGQVSRKDAVLLGLWTETRCVRV